MQTRQAVVFGIGWTPRGDYADGLLFGGVSVALHIILYQAKLHLGELCDFMTPDDRILDMIKESWDPAFRS